MAWAEDMESQWAPPVPCRACGQPMPRSAEACPACGEPRGLAPAARTRRLVARLAWTGGWLGERAADATILALLLGLGVLLLPVSPLLVLFPLLLVRGAVGKPPEPGQARRRKRATRRHQRLQM